MLKGNTSDRSWSWERHQKSGSYLVPEGLLLRQETNLRSKLPDLFSNPSESRDEIPVRGVDLSHPGFWTKSSRGDFENTGSWT